MPSTEGPSDEVPSSETPGGPGDGAGGMLPTTGSMLIPLGIVAAILIAVGTAALVLSRRRRLQ